MVDGYLWGDAEVAYADMVGTAQIDERKTAPPIERQVGLDFDKWHIVGVDIGGGELGHELKVIAVAKSALPEDRGGDVFPEIAAANGGDLPVTEFLIHDVDPYAVLRQITHQFEMKLRITSTVGLPIRVIDSRDIPTQELE